MNLQDVNEIFGTVDNTNKAIENLTIEDLYYIYAATLGYATTHLSTVYQPEAIPDRLKKLKAEANMSVAMLVDKINRKLSKVEVKPQDVCMHSARFGYSVKVVTCASKAIEANFKVTCPVIKTTMTIDAAAEKIEGAYAPKLESHSTNCVLTTDKMDGLDLFQKEQRPDLCKAITILDTLLFGIAYNELQGFFRIWKEIDLKNIKLDSMINVNAMNSLVQIFNKMFFKRMQMQKKKAMNSRQCLDAILDELRSYTTEVVNGIVTRLVQKMSEVYPDIEVLIGGRKTLMRNTRFVAGLGIVPSDKFYELKAAEGAKELQFALLANSFKNLIVDEVFHTCSAAIDGVHVLKSDALHREVAHLTHLMKEARISTVQGDDKETYDEAMKRTSPAITLSDINLGERMTRRELAHVVVLHKQKAPPKIVNSTVIVWTGKPIRSPDKPAKTKLEDHKGTVLATYCEYGSVDVLRVIPIAATAILVPEDVGERKTADGTVIRPYNPEGLSIRYAKGYDGALMNWMFIGRPGHPDWHYYDSLCCSIEVVRANSQYAMLRKIQYGRFKVPMMPASTFDYTFFSIQRKNDILEFEFTLEKYAEGSEEQVDEDDGAAEDELQPAAMDFDATQDMAALEAMVDAAEKSDA